MMNEDAVNARNPTSIKLTQEQMDKSFRESYWAFAIRYGLQYYVAGRFATANRFTPVCANLLRFIAFIGQPIPPFFKNNRARADELAHHVAGVRGRAMYRRSELTQPERFGRFP